MKYTPITLLLVAAALLATPASAQDEGQTEFTLVAGDGGGSDFHFASPTGERNPTLVVAPGQEITITLQNEGGFHNIQVEGFDPSEYVENAGDTVTYTFTAPESGTLEYWCVPHKSSGMAGTIRVAGTPDAPADAPSDAEQNSTPGLGLVGALLALAGVAALRRK